MSLSGSIVPTMRGSFSWKNSQSLSPLSFLVSRSCVPTLCFRSLCCIFHYDQVLPVVMFNLISLFQPFLSSYYPHSYHVISTTLIRSSSPPIASFSTTPIESLFPHISLYFKDMTFFPTILIH